MTPKHIASVGLLVFVGVSAAVLVAKEVGREDAIDAAAARAPAAEADGDAAPRYVVFYLHGSYRCASCRKLEAYTEAAARGAYAADLASGRMAWRPVNVDEPENAHFAKDYRLVGKAVVFSEQRGGAQTRWVSVARLWDFLDDKARFTRYIQDELGAFIGAGPT